MNSTKNLESKVDVQVDYLDLEHRSPRNGRSYRKQPNSKAYLIPGILEPKSISSPLLKTFYGKMSAQKKKTW